MMDEPQEALLVLLHNLRRQLSAMMAELDVGTDRLPLRTLASIAESLAVTCRQGAADASTVHHALRPWWEPAPKQRTNPPDSVGGMTGRATGFKGPVA